PSSPPMVRELLAHPREAQDAEAIFRSALPAPLIELVNRPEPAAPRPFMALVNGYVQDLAAVQKRLQEAVAPFDDGLPSADQLLRAGAGVNALQLEITKAEFTLVTLRFAQALRVATDLPTQ